MSLLLDAASGYTSGPQMQAWMQQSWAIIVDDPSFQVYLPVEFTESIHTWVDYIVAQGGTPLRTLFVTTAILYPQVWEKVAGTAPPYSPLRHGMENFCFGRPGFDNPDKYLLSVNREFRIHFTSPLGPGPSIKFSPKAPLREREMEITDSPKIKDLEHTTKTNHHSQLHLRTAQSTTDHMRVTHEVSETYQHIEFTNVLIALVTRIWCFSFVEASHIQ